MARIYAVLIYILELSYRQALLIFAGLAIFLFLILKVTGCIGGSTEDISQVLKKPVRDGLTKKDKSKNVAPLDILYIKKNTTGYKKVNQTRVSGARIIPAVWHGGKAYLPITKEKIRNNQHWVKVMIQDRPNQSKLWVPFSKASMKVYRGSDVIDIDSKTQTLRRYNNERLLLKAKVVLGKKETPTPKGRYFVTHLSATPDPSYGPFMLVTNAHSETIEDFGGLGDAIVAIHGPIDSTSSDIAKGARLSNGCVRLKMRYLKNLRDVKPGSLIIIH